MILEQALQILSPGKGMTISEIAEKIPALCGHEEGYEILKLLFRLDRRFENNGDLWFCSSMPSDPSAMIIAATREYFALHPRGELLEHLAREVAGATGEEIQGVRRIILNTFQSIQGGKMILNKTKEKVDG